MTNTHTQILSAVLGPSKGNEQKKALALRTSHSSTQTEKSILSGGKFHEKKKKRIEKSEKSEGWEGVFQKPQPLC